MKKTYWEWKKIGQAFCLNGFIQTLLLLCILIGSACNKRTKPLTKVEKKNVKINLPEQCADAWSNEIAAAFVRDLKLATETSLQVWDDYDLGDVAYLLNAGELENGEYCLGVWQKGKALAYTTLPEAPKLLTPLYGYYLTYDDITEDADSTLLTKSQQPASVSAWLEDLGVKRAVVMPVDFPKFPFKIPALTKVQLAIHEAFHIEVQIKYWHTAKGTWPAWDLQPDRNGLLPCYTKSEQVKESFQKERQSLVALIEALLDGHKTEACQAGNKFLETRAARYEILNDVIVLQHDESPGNCMTSETILELEEGIADYASWTMLFELGLASREKLIQRYQAIQDEPFYLTGAMQLHAISLLSPDETQNIIKRIANSKSPEEGSLTSILAEMLENYCGKE